jgi:hypothetical protein
MMGSRIVLLADIYDLKTLIALEEKLAEMRDVAKATGHLVCASSVEAKRESVANMIERCFQNEETTRAISRHQLETNWFGGG